MRGHLHTDDAAAEVGLNPADVRAHRARGELEGTGDYVTIASLRRFQASRRHGAALRIGQWAQDVRRVALYPHDDVARERIRNAANVAASELTGVDGGFVGTAELSNAVASAMQAENALPNSVTRVVTNAKEIILPIDPRQGHDTASGGVITRIVPEFGAAAQDKPNLSRLKLQLEKLMALVPVSDELVEDAPSLGSYLPDAVAKALNYALTEQILRGDGELFTGFIGAGCTVTIAPEGAQAASSVVAKNIEKVVGAVAATSLATAKVVSHSDGAQQIRALGQPYWTPGDAQAPHGRCLGLPLLVTEAAPGPGKLGEVSAIDPAAFLIAIRQPEVRSTFTMHFDFSRAVSAYRAIVRVAGAPMWSKPVASRDSAVLRSAFVTLAARP